MLLHGARRKSQYLVKKTPSIGLAAHIADDFRAPLCKTLLNPATWELCEAPPKLGILIRRNCRNKQARMQHRRANEDSFNNGSLAG